VQLTKRGKVVTAVAVTLAVAIAGLGTLAFTGHGPGPLQRLVAPLVHHATPCPLTGVTLPDGQDAPARPMIAVKVGNTEAAYPLAGLDHADVIYEELVEGGLTRFIVLLQCERPDRVGPVRSARVTDPGLLQQYLDPPILAYSGASPRVDAFVADAGVVSLTESSAGAAFTRDPSRVAPHNLYVSVPELERQARRAGADETPPAQVFAYSDDVPEHGKRARSASISFSFSTSGDWAWSHGRWVRQFDGEPMRLEDGAPLAVDNVLIQEIVVRRFLGSSPVVSYSGSGRAWLLRDGRVVRGRWTRASMNDVTRFVTASGDDLALKPGTTFIELVPEESGSVTIGR
jgi:hypothetical protein